MTYTVLYSAPLIKSHSKTEEVAYITVWIAITQFMNMALIPIITARTGEIDADWYQNVGLNILGNFGLYTVTPHASGLISPFVYLYLDRTTGYMTAVDQNDFNKM